MRPSGSHVNLARDIPEAYRILRARNGHLHWWPGRTRLEVIVGAILTQNTAWSNVEKAIRALKASGLLSIKGLRSASLRHLQQAIRPSGYFRQKARKLRAFTDFLDSEYAGNLTRMGKTPADELRARLLSIWGIGPETADSILLYAFGHPVFVVDAYTRRVAAHHDWAGPRVHYDELQDLFVRHLPRDVDLYNDYHAQMVWVGKHHCRPRPRCEGCPLQPLLPNGRLSGPRSLRQAEHGQPGRPDPRSHRGTEVCSVEAPRRVPPPARRVSVDCPSAGSSTDPATAGLGEKRGPGVSRPCHRRIAAWSLGPSAPSTSPTTRPTSVSTA